MPLFFAIKTASTAAMTAHPIMLPASGIQIPFMTLC